MSSLLFYYSERFIAGREDIDLFTSMYWSIITMATIGYGDVTPVKGLGWIVAGFTAIMGILAYTLIISVVADWFLSSSIKRSLGLSPLKKKEILVIGDGDSCLELVDELILNGLKERVGWLIPEKPDYEPPVDYMVGDPRKDYVLRRAGIENAKYIILCFRDDSLTLHTALISRKYNKDAVYSAVVNSSAMEDLLREAGVSHVLSQRMLGRAIASVIFEQSVLMVLTDIVSAKGRGDLVEEIIGREHSGKTISEYEEELNKRGNKYKYRVLALNRNEQLELLPEPTTILKEGDRIVLLKAVKKHEL